MFEVQATRPDRLPDNVAHVDHHELLPDGRPAVGVVLVATSCIHGKRAAHFTSYSVLR